MFNLDLNPAYVFLTCPAYFSGDLLIETLISHTVRHFKLYQFHSKVCIKECDQ